jgi:hypothetical protein
MPKMLMEGKNSQDEGIAQEHPHFVHDQARGMT